MSSEDQTSCKLICNLVIFKKRVEEQNKTGQDLFFPGCVKKTGKEGLRKKQGRKQHE